MKKTTLIAPVAALVAIAGLTLAPGEKPAAPAPIKALLVTGGCCHDYDMQKVIIPAGISERANVDWTVVHEGGARPVIMLTKAGLVTGPERFVEQARAIAPGVDVHAVDVIAGLGGHEIDGVDTYRRKLAALRNANAVLVSVLRGRRLYRVTIPLYRGSVRRGP